MFKILSTMSLCLTAGAFALPSLAAPQPAPTQAAAAAMPDSQGAPVLPLFQDVSQLQQTVVLDTTDRPLGDVLAALSPSLSVDLLAERDVADQRVTLHLTGQPAYLLMDRLVRLFSHSPDSPHGYHWEQLNRGAGVRPAFRLWRDSRSVSEEAYARDYPQREIGVLLRDLRNMAGMTPQEQGIYKGDDPHKFTALPSFIKAFRGLSDDQLDALAAGQALPLDPVLFADDTEAVHQEQVDRLLRQQQSALTNGLPDPYPKGLPDVPQAPSVLTVTLADSGSDDAPDVDLQGPTGRYLVSLGGAANRGLVLDTYDTTKSRAPDRLPPPRASGPVVDLTPLLTAKNVTRAQRSDVGFTLQAVARAAHVTVYQEDFLRGSVHFESSDPAPGGPGVGLNPLKAPLPVLIAAVCAHWNYQYRKIGDDYLFWSRTWAQDRADDVPERLLGPWRQRLAKHGSLTFDDRAEMAAALTWRQVNLTLGAALPESGPWVRASYPWLRFIGQLAPGQEQAAFSDGGLPLGALAPWQQGELVADLGGRLKDVTADQLGGAALTLREEDNPAASSQSYIMNLQAGDTRLLGSRVFIPVSPLPAPDSSATPKSGG